MTTDITQYARGNYQLDLLTGRARWSGSDLVGRAAKYGGRYAHSRKTLLARLRAAGIDARVANHKNDNARIMRILVVDGVPVSATR